MRKALSILGRSILRSLMVLGVSGLVIAVLYIPAQWRRPEIQRRVGALRLTPGELQRRINRERRPPPFPVRMRMIANQLLAIVVIAWIGRRVLRLRLNG